MSAALIPLPTARPSVADDTEERTQLFRPNQKRPTWKDVERARAAAPTPAPTAEVTRFFPKPGRTPPARLQLVQAPPDTRASSPAPARKPAAHVPPYLRKGYRWDLLGQELHDHLQAEMDKAARIRSCPRSLAKLLDTPEWKGSSVSEPQPHELERMRKLCEASLREAQEARSDASTPAQKRAADALFDARKARLERLCETVRIVHPSGASILWLPTDT